MGQKQSGAAEPEGYSTGAAANNPFAAESEPPAAPQSGGFASQGYQQDRAALWNGADERAAQRSGNPWGADEVDDAGCSKLRQIQKLQDDSLKTTERTMQRLGEAREVGLHTNDMLAVQGEQIDRIQSVLDKMHTDLDYSDQLMKKLASPFGFSGKVKQHAKTFERLHGGMAEWSGPMNKRGDTIKRYRPRFFALLNYQLFYFTDALHLKTPKGVMSLTGARIERVPESPGHKYEFRLLVSKPKEHTYYLQCTTDREYLGWLAMLERKINPGAWKSEKRLAGAAKDNLDARAAGATVGDVGLRGSKGYGLNGEGGVARDAESAKLQFERQLDSNLDSISNMLSDLGEIAQAQAAAVEMQSAKLDRVETGVEDATVRINKLNGRGRKMLR